MAQPATTVPDDSSVKPETPKKELGPVFKVAAGPTKWLDDRIGIAGLSRPFFRKVFPDHWSFLLGEIALYSFIVLILSGIFLTIWFKPSMSEVEYQGSYELLRGLQMSDAYASTLDLSFRHSRRSVAAADAPLGRCGLRRRNAHPQLARFLHRRVPQAA
jgi:ubiquinol-cytochrome c reductase cytochrome b subunit